MHENSIKIHCIMYKDTQRCLPWVNIGERWTTELNFACMWSYLIPIPIQIVQPQSNRQHLTFILEMSIFPTTQIQSLNLNVMHAVSLILASFYTSVFLDRAISFVHSKYLIVHHIILPTSDNLLLFVERSKCLWVSDFGLLTNV